LTRSYSRDTVRGVRPAGVESKTWVSKGFRRWSMYRPKLLSLSKEINIPKESTLVCKSFNSPLRVPALFSEVGSLHVSRLVNGVYLYPYNHQGQKFSMMSKNKDRTIVVPDHGMRRDLIPHAFLLPVRPSILPFYYGRIVACSLKLHSPTGIPHQHPPQAIATAFESAL